MSRKLFLFAPCLIMLCACCEFAVCQDGTKASSDVQSYTLRMPVDEVKVTFHVSDGNGEPIEHLKKDDVQLLDNGKLQRRTVAFHEYRDLPIRVGFLLDNSSSMRAQMDRSQLIASELIKDFFRPESDRAFTMGFGLEQKTTQDWTENAEAVGRGITAGLVGEPNGNDGTAMFDAIYRACQEKFSGGSSELSGNFILLFTDGDDNSSRVWEGQAVDMCQRARTAIYAFVPEWKTRASRGEQILEDLVMQTGGRMFYQSRQSIHDSLALAVSDMRYQYELIYSPPGLKRNGAFHRIKMKCKTPHSQVQVRSGYYAYAKEGSAK